ncbi:hypothetical protein WQ54_11400 [Bacillus sp. SA1-12]|uniref:hypothetical protein n=1 Tax=Bacillus sp. SA1-12 TaxID=1455638 RepID=UPI000626127F|nr:hypothetical protein [Bacillus sp. SA1-12]KKI92041.1 hypothetical protein WQ54_11400 [Bacillus sp. SA1-12]
MSQRIGNVGVLNLMNATEESIKEIDRIENVGMVLFRPENAHLLSALNIGNIGTTIEVPEDFTLYNGVLHLNEAFLNSISEPVKLLVDGTVIIEKDVKPEQMKTGLLYLKVNGKVYSPPHLSGAVNQIVKEGVMDLKTYDGAAPRFENGKLSITNSFLQALEEPQNLVVNGLLTFSEDLNMEQFGEKINKLEINGNVILFEEQESFLYKKAVSIAGKVEVIPSGYEMLNKPLQVNGRSIRRFHKKKFYTRKPVIFEKDVTRELLLEAISSIHSTSLIICHEDVEDLVFELTSLLETEVLTYQNLFVLIEGEEIWSNDQFRAMEQPVNMIVNGQLHLDQDIEEAVLREKVLTLDILGKVLVPDKKCKGFLQNIIRLNTGILEAESTKQQTASLNNVGRLSL